MAAPARARAAPPAPVKQLYDDAYALAKESRWAAAYPLLQRAFAADPSWQIAELLGHAEVELGRYRDAAAHLTLFLRASRQIPEVSARERAAHEELLARAAARVGEIAVTVDPPGAEILLDGEPAGRAPLADPLFVDPGRHHIEARREGHAPAAVTEDLAGGRAARVTLRLRPLPPPQVSPPPPRWTGADSAIVIGGSAASAALGAVGAAFTLKANRASAAAMDCASPGMPCEFSQAGTRPGQFRRLEGDRISHTRVAGGALIGAGALAAGTILYAILIPARKRPLPLSAAAGPGGAAATLSLSW